MTYHGKIFLLPKHRFFSPWGRGTMGEMGLFWKKRGARKKTVAHYVALNSIVWLLVASINRPLSGCLNQNDSNTKPVMMPLSAPHAEQRDGLVGVDGGAEERAETKEKRTRRKGHIMRNATKGGKENPRGELGGASPTDTDSRAAVHIWAPGGRSESPRRCSLWNQTSGPVREGEDGGRRWR